MTDHTAMDAAFRRFTERVHDYLFAVANAADSNPHLAADLIEPQIVADAAVLVKEGPAAYLRRLDENAAFRRRVEQAAKHATNNKEGDHDA